MVCAVASVLSLSPFASPQGHLQREPAVQRERKKEQGRKDAAAIKQRPAQTRLGRGCQPERPTRPGCMSLHIQVINKKKKKEISSSSSFLSVLEE